MPDEKDGYVIGEIKATKGDIVSVGIPGGEVCINRENNFSLEKHTHIKFKKFFSYWIISSFFSGKKHFLFFLKAFFLSFSLT